MEKPKLEKSKMSDAMQTPLERAMFQRSEHLVESFMIIGAPVSNTFFPESNQELLYQFPKAPRVNEQVVQFLKSPTPFERISLKKYLEEERMKPAVSILPGRGLSQFAVAVSHLEPVCMHSTLIQGPNVFPSTISSFNAVRRFYIFICLQPHVQGLIQALEVLIDRDFKYKLKALVEKKKEKLNELKREQLEEILNSLLTTNSNNLKTEKLQIPCLSTDYKGYPIILSYKKNKEEEEQVSLEIRYSSIYPIPNLMLLCDFSLPILFASLPVNLILDVFEAVVLETSVIFTSTKPTNFTACCFGFLSLLHPLSWQGVFLPLVPQNHVELLDAPVPGIYGTQPLKENPSTSGLLVNIDMFTPSVSERKKQQHTFSSQSLLPKELRESLQQNVESVIEKQPRKEGEEFAFSTNMIKVFWLFFFKRVFNELLTTIPVDDDNFDHLKEGVEKSEKDPQLKNFLLKLIKTQHFNAWWFSQYTPFKHKIREALSATFK
ncbi:hypothetical protein EIN_054470 [Entamoeba invadens IP1]|uniref:hypothetical protein n=1 Tax=Entamoeba invadens IP1 TaxID=370355 RepID=UPI0002C3F93C|nr:hypothetical protein EIN_054470 [Entamoeba invadens IP1]ELP93162.1 hypothetical protein EIN_054470 [Entamoeba invadens IP1]|eukprot:XP_004259933.1 hypothetical protein EIN_054470 [Entamoeba invadens IP1]